MGEPNRSAAQQKLELEAYTAVLRALAATAMDWVRLHSGDSCPSILEGKSPVICGGRSSCSV